MGFSIFATCRVASRAKARHGQGRGWGGLVMERASFSLGRQAPARRRTLIPSTLLRGTPRAGALRPSIFLFNTVCVVSSPLALYISHPLPIPRGPSCPRARVYVCDGRGGKRSKVSPRGALNLPSARFLQTGCFDPLFTPCVLVFLSGWRVPVPGRITRECRVIHQN